MLIAIGIGSLPLTTFVALIKVRTSVVGFFIFPTYFARETANTIQKVRGRRCLYY